MCDTLVALASTTAAGATLFAKNSDRSGTRPRGSSFTRRGTTPRAASYA